MPLFILASGFLSGQKVVEWSVFLKNKTLRLIVPYITFSLIFVLKRNVTANYTGNERIVLGGILYQLLIGENYWFLWVLFVILVSYKLLGYRLFGILSVVNTVIFYYAGDVLPFSISRLVQLSIFFEIGVLLRKYYDRILPYLKTFKCLSLSIFIFSATILSGINESFYMFHFIVPLLGCLMIWSFSIYIAERVRTYTLLGHFGKFSLQYYLNHLVIISLVFYIVYFLKIDCSLINMIITFAIALSLSYFLLYIEQNFKALSRLSGL